MNPFLGILIILLLGMALPAGLAKNSWRWFFIALPLSFFAVVLPLFAFLTSSLLVPEWKGICEHGWLDCFILGKLALAPLALVATAALYSVEVLRVKNRTDRWIVLGIFFGAIISVACLAFAVFCAGFARDRGWILLLVPVYVAIWYSVRAVQLIKESGMTPVAYLGALLGSLPFWIAGLLWSKYTYANLPDQPPQGCFVVTAAGRGHVKLVGPFVEIQHRGRTVLANEQLITLWKFENVWRQRAPRSHKHFRQFYNRFGPVLARQIKSPWLADLAYLTIKPCELAVKPIITKRSRP